MYEGTGTVSPLCARFIHSVQRKFKDYHEGITSSDKLYHHHELQIHSDALFSTEYDLKQSTVPVRVNLLGAHVLCAWRYWRTMADTN